MFGLWDDAMHCTSKHRRCDTTTHLPGKSLKPFSSPPMRRAIFLYPEGGKPVNEPMTFLDLFSGVGGFRKGFELCGMVCKGHCEIDNSQTAVTAPYTIYRRTNGMEKILPKPNPTTCEGQPMAGRIPVSGYFCIWPGKEGFAGKTKLSLF